MEIIPQIFTAKVMHKRLFPKVNSFTYGVYYVALPLSELVGNLPLSEIIKNRVNKIFENSTPHDCSGLPYNKFGTLSFHDKDFGAKDGSNLDKWVRKTLKKHELNDITQDIILIAMPRVLGYVFNPVSFWLCLDKKGDLRAVLCQVSNTFGETHSYLCAHEKGKPIKSDDWLEATKLFHVSPFLKREGHYKFRFSLNEKNLGIWIDFYDAAGKKQLITSLVGTLAPLTPSNLRKAFWQHPLVTLKTIFLIHWQALKLVAKGIRYIPKPSQLKKRLSKTGNIKKM